MFPETLSEKIFLAKKNTTYFKVSEIILELTRFTNNKKLFNKVDINNKKELFDFIDDIEKNIEKYKIDEEIIQKKTKKEIRLENEKDLFDRVRDLVPSNIYQILEKKYKGKTNSSTNAIYYEQQKPEDKLPKLEEEQEQEPEIEDIDEEESGSENNSEDSNSENGNNEYCTTGGCNLLDKGDLNIDPDAPIDVPKEKMDFLFDENDTKNEYDFDDLNNMDGDDNMSESEFSE